MPLNSQILPAVGQFKLETNQQGVEAAVFAVLGLEADHIQTVASGETQPVRPDAAAVWSPGFRHCTGYIVRAGLNFGFTHAWPRDEETLKAMRQNPPAEALLVYGTQSEPQHGLELFLGTKGLLREIHADTGSSPFGIMFQVESGLVSVVRTEPIPSVLQYAGFDAASQ